MVCRIVNYFFQHEKDICFDVARDNGYILKDKIMSPEFVAAMVSEANIGVGSFTIMNQYLSSFLEKKIMPNETDIYRGQLACDQLPPTILTI